MALVAAVGVADSMCTIRVRIGQSPGFSVRVSICIR